MDTQALERYIARRIEDIGNNPASTRGGQFADEQVLEELRGVQSMMRTLQRAADRDRDEAIAAQVAREAGDAQRAATLVARRWDHVLGAGVPTMPGIDPDEAVDEYNDRATGILAGRNP